MRKNQRFVRGYQWPQEKDPFDVEAPYVANLTKREINQRVASIYAKNPTFVAKLRNRLWYEIWSGDEGDLVASGHPLVGVEVRVEPAERAHLYVSAVTSASHLIVATENQQLEVSKALTELCSSSTISRMPN